MKPGTIGIVVIFGLLCFRAFAVAPGKLRDDEVLPGITNKIAVLEYANPGNTRWGLELSEILTREIIGSIRGVSSVGVVTLRQDESHVDLNLENVLGIARTQKVSAVIWGEFYESGDKIHLHSHLRIIQAENSTRSPLALSAQTPGGSVKATPPSLLLNFAPIEFTTESLKAIRTSHQETRTIRSQPQEAAAVVGRLKTEDAFWVEEIKGRWMRIRTQAGTPGWVYYTALDNQAGLAGLRALVFFAQGVLQYTAGNFKAAETTVSNYLKRSGNQNAANLALAHIVRGNARFEARGRQADEQVIGDYLAAAELVPNEPAPANYLAVVQLLKFGGEKRYVPEMRDLETRLVRAVQTQNNLEALDNLKVFYALAADSKFIQRPAMSPEEYSTTIAKQRIIIEAIAGKLIPAP